MALRFLALTAAVLSISSSSIAAPNTVKMVRMRNYRSQDAVRDSLRYALFQMHDHGLSFWTREYPINGDFFNNAEINAVKVIPEHPELHYKLWLQPAKAPLVVILPGLGGHYQGVGLNAMAQTYFDAGYSVIVISSSMNWEFYVAASRSKAPGYSPLDAKDIRAALQKIVHDARRLHPGEIGDLHLIGFSLGAVHTLFIAKQETESQNKIGFKSYLAIHPPVDMRTAMSTLDAFFDKWRTWPKNRVLLEIEKAVAAYLAIVKNGLPKDKQINIGEDAAKVLIALSYRYALRELLLAVKKTGNDMGLIKTEHGFYKNDLHKELNSFDFKDYTAKFITKAVENRTRQKISLKELDNAGSIKSLSTFLKKSKNIRVLGSMDDFLRDKNDLKWFAETFGDRALFFEHGGHLGELYTKDAKRVIVELIKHKVER